MTQQDYKNMVQELNNCDEDLLNEWECSFLDDMARRGSDFTVNQMNKIEQIWDKVVGGDEK